MDIKIAQDFSKVPAGRYHPIDGDKTGQRFRTEYLAINLAQSNAELEINLDGAVGYPSSFLEEAFGGLVRAGYTVEQLESRLKIVTTEPQKQRYIDQIWKYIRKAKENSIA